MSNVVLDVVYLGLGVGVFGVFIAYTLFLKRV
jgi:hypothetical protein